MAEVATELERTGMGYRGYPYGVGYIVGPFLYYKAKLPPNFHPAVHEFVVWEFRDRMTTDMPVVGESEHKKR